MRVIMGLRPRLRRTLLASDAHILVGTQTFNIRRKFFINKIENFWWNNEYLSPNTVKNVSLKYQKNARKIVTSNSFDFCLFF